MSLDCGGGGGVGGGGGGGGGLDVGVHEGASGAALWELEEGAR